MWNRRVYAGIAAGQGIRVWCIIVVHSTAKISADNFEGPKGCPGERPLALGGPMGLMVGSLCSGAVDQRIKIQGPGRMTGVSVLLQQRKKSFKSSLSLFAHLRLRSSFSTFSEFSVRDVRSCSNFSVANFLEPTTLKVRLRRK